MPTFIETLATLDADKAAAFIPCPTTAIKTTVLFASGDHWQNGLNSVAALIPADIDQYASVLQGAQNDFTPIPVIGELVSRRVTGVVGREPTFNEALSRELPEGEFPTTQEEQDIAEADSALGAWWDQRNGHEEVKKFARYLCTHNRAVFDIFLPPEKLDEAEDGTLSVNAPDLPSALEYLYFQAVDPSQATVYTHKGSMRDIGVCRYSDEEVEATTEGATLVQKDRVRVTFTEDGQTVIQQYDKGDLIGTATVDCGGEILAIQATAGEFITEPMRALQRSIDLLNSMLPRNGRYAGHRGRHAIGLKRPTETNRTTGEEEEVEPLLGAGRFNFWQSATYRGDDGKEKHAPAQLVFEEPIDSGPLRADIQHFEERLLRAGNQLHTVISGDAMASAVSRVQARAEFADSLLELKPEIEGALRKLLRCVLLLGVTLTGDKAKLQRFKELRTNVTIKADAGPLSPDERRVLIEEYKAGLRSRETVMVLLGSEDIEDEIRKVESEPDVLLDTEIKRAELFEAWARTFPVHVAAVMAQLSDEQLQVLQDAGLIRRDSEGRVLAAAEAAEIVPAAVVESEELEVVA